MHTTNQVILLLTRGTLTLDLTKLSVVVEAVGDPPPPPTPLPAGYVAPLGAPLKLAERELFELRSAAMLVRSRVNQGQSGAANDTAARAAAEAATVRREKKKSLPPWPSHSSCVRSN